MSLLQIIASDNFIPVNKCLVKKFGLEEAIILCQLITEYTYYINHDMLKDEMFYCTVNKLEDATTLSEYQQRKAIKNLEKFGVIKTELKGIPAVRYFYIDENKILSFLTSSSEKTKELVTEKLQSSNNHISNNQKNKTKKEKDSGFKEIFDKEVEKVHVTESIDNFISLYNSHCTNLPKVYKLTDKRRKAINAILKKYSTDEIIQAFDLANESDFLIGKNDRGWKADIDFILREDKFINILEGKYGGRKRTNTSHASSDMGRTNAQYTAEQRKQFKEALRNGEAERI